jgi:hypothetical protein
MESYNVWLKSRKVAEYIFWKRTRGINQCGTKNQIFFLSRKDLIVVVGLQLILPLSGCFCLQFYGILTTLPPANLMLILPMSICWTSGVINKTRRLHPSSLDSCPQARTSENPLFYHLVWYSGCLFILDHHFSLNWPQPCLMILVKRFAVIHNFHKYHFKWSTCLMLLLCLTELLIIGMNNISGLREKHWQVFSQDSAGVREGYLE